MRARSCCAGELETASTINPNCRVVAGGDPHNEASPPTRLAQLTTCSTSSTPIPCRRTEPSTNTPTIVGCGLFSGSKRTGSAVVMPANWLPRLRWHRLPAEQRRKARNAMQKGCAADHEPEQARDHGGEQKRVDPPTFPMQTAAPLSHRKACPGAERAHPRHRNARPNDRTSARRSPSSLREER